MRKFKKGRYRRTMGGIGFFSKEIPKKIVVSKKRWPIVERCWPRPTR